MLLLRCTLYKQQIDTCRNCGRVGHRQDVSALTHLRKFEHCGIKPTGPDHECVTPKCTLCGQAPITGDCTCPNRYQVPYVVRRRRHRRHRRNKNQQTQGGSATQQLTPKQPSPTPPTKHVPTTTKNPTATPTWADRITGKVVDNSLRSLKSTRSFSLEVRSGRRKELPAMAAQENHGPSNVAVLLQPPPPAPPNNIRLRDPPVFSGLRGDDDDDDDV
ncbi:hypothetical protein HPB51_009930 [Rhipicephalus microplus]|uniref:Uncharacterized protein n=1 Tax=Rhipicephalus microplus TaxID=6941 RepID=A0A9J6ET22_RHIMP|nr:hypothetical protein HPB51_009930 [Rhipicephalus microplus]